MPPSVLPRPVHRLRQDMVAILLFWTLVTLGLGFSSYLDLRHRGDGVTLWRALALSSPLMLPQISFSLLVAWLLHRHPQWLDRPAPLLLGALLALPLYVCVAVPIEVALFLLARNRPLSGYLQMLGKWEATMIWMDAVIASAGMALQLGWAFWRHAQAQREAALKAQADNLRLRLTLLQGQLEPHFMFNTLNSIAALVRGAERGVALQAISRLSELLRYALRASQQRWVSVADELRFVEDYVALQRLRFGEGLSWQAEVEAGDWARWACPPLLLQPLVENAVRYGLEAAEPGRQAILSFRLRAVPQGVEVCLSNPSPEAAKLLAGHGVGLAKTRERLQVLYGARASIETETLSQRFELRLCLPLDDLDAALEAASEDTHA